MQAHFNAELIIEEAKEKWNHIEMMLYCQRQCHLLSQSNIFLQGRLTPIPKYIVRLNILFRFQFGYKASTDIPRPPQTQMNVSRPKE